MLKEFKNFMVKDNVVNMDVGIIIVQYHEKIKDHSCYC
ncbi:MAG: MscL family protein [Endomicrobium sp.]|nr:MscL family protein [Endomicrobium sp.]